MSFFEMSRLAPVRCDERFGPVTEAALPLRRRNAFWRTAVRSKLVTRNGLPG